MARNRYLPAIFEALNARHVPLFSIAVATALGFLFLMPFPSWQALIKIITSATVLSYGLQPLALSALRRQAPELERPFRLPAAEVLAPVAFIVAILIIYWGGWETNRKLMVAIGVGLALLALNYVCSSPERRPVLDWRVAGWLVPYLAGLTVISFLGAKDFDGRGVFRSAGTRS
jgi:amino acid transporter